MELTRIFEYGGAPMWFTLVFGLLLVGAGVLYAIRPERRYVPLLTSLGVTTLASGLIGFTVGVIYSLMFIGGVGPDRRYVALIGVAESLVNVAFALFFVLLAGLLAGVAALRIARAAAPPGAIAGRAAERA